MRVSSCGGSVRAALWMAGVATVVLVASLTLDGQMPPVSLSIELPDNPTAGARLFVEKRCVRCHALGNDESRLGPNLGRIQFRGTVLDLAGSLWNHAPAMREKMQDLKIQPPTLDARELADLLAFLTAYRYYLTEVGQPGDPSAGRTLFQAKGCVGCHGPNGAFQTPGPSLDPLRGTLSAILLAQTMWNHGPEMAAVMRGRGVPWPRFSGREMGDLLAFLQAGSPGSDSERVYFEPGSPRRGRDLFAGRCAVCHAIAGAGGRVAPDLGTGARELVGSVPAIAGLMWNHSQGMMAELQRRGLARVTFSGQEMADVIAYLYFVNYANVRGQPDRGARLFADKCAACHSLGGGTRVGPDLSGTGLEDPVAILAGMWNHAPAMEQELRRRGLPWPRLEPGEAADLTAFLLGRRLASPRS